MTARPIRRNAQTPDRNAKFFTLLLLLYHTSAKEQGLLYIDFYKTIAEADYRGEILYAGDVHPNELGYHYMYETARDVLKAGL